MTLQKAAAMVGMLAATFAGTVFAAEGPAPRQVPHLDHVFFIAMENHAYGQIVDNPSAVFINNLAKAANIATNYYAIGHPSSTNYLEVVGGSNFGVRSDNAPDWHNASCTPNLATGAVTTDNPASPKVCPIAGFGTDAETPAVDTTNETQGSPGENDIDGVTSIPAASDIVGKSIADQLVAARLSWKTYQESLPLSGADNVTYSDGFFTDTTFFPGFNLASSDFVLLYAAKHNPFVYFKSVQEGASPNHGLANVVGFDGPAGLYADLRSGRVPSFSFIVPNQCNDQHGRSNAGNTCAFDPSSNGTQTGLNPALIYRGDVTLQRLVEAIWASPAWKVGDNAIVVWWDENDYSLAPNVNKVLVIVDTNYGKHGVQSPVLYNHFSLLKTIEAGFGLPCLNHACDGDVAVMSDLFGR
ncbi:MAG TPA: alkaline phosphatase family protein [Thermoanaerobaculia bacterium]|nr:alkaline phosphatase family protein [Thermoanaerobaculia bacterium]